MTVICRKHGQQKAYLDNWCGKLRCCQCRINSIRATRRNAKLLLVNLLGGKCCKCGYTKCMKALEFHHKNPKTKAFSISKELGRKSIKVLTEEARKCYLVCANCHAEIHADEFDWI